MPENSNSKMDFKNRKFKFKNGFQILISKIKIINKKIKSKNLLHYIIIIINTYTLTYTYTITHTNTYTNTL